MRKLLAILVVLLMGCSGGPGSTPGGGQTTAATPQPPASDAPTSSTPAESESAAGVIPADCAKGLTDYLVAIEPIVSGFDPAAAKLGDVPALDENVRVKDMELLDANDGRATYSCSEVGLEWAYFDSKTPWEAVLAIAGDAAPGTVAYLTAMRAMSNMDVAEIADYGVEGCPAAVDAIKKGVAAQTKAGKDGVEEMGLEDGMALLGLYRAYMHDVGEEICPRDELGNDEFGFFGAMG
jgi:hypothetical protein